MSKAIQVSIPKPCAEDWNSFTPTTTGGFCGSCQKNVIDFTTATDEEIIAFISRKPVHACGRFRLDQLKTYAHQPITVKPGFRLLKASVASLFLLLSKPSFAETQREPAIVVQGINTHQSTVSDSQREIHGIVRDSSGHVLSGASVFIAGTTVGTPTDEQGRYSLLIPSTGTTLTYSYIGLKTQHIKITDQDSVNVILDADPVMLEEISILGSSTTTHKDLLSGLIVVERESWFKRLVRRVKEIIRRN